MSKSKREADMEDGREVGVRGGRFEGYLFFFGLYGLFIFLLFHTIKTMILVRCDIVYI